MATRLRKNKAARDAISPPAIASGASFFKSISRWTDPSVWVPVLLAAVAFGVYWPSLKSDFVYDGRNEILQEGFVTSLSNLPAICSLKVLSMDLGVTPEDRPGQLFFLMLNAALWGKEPWGYHLSSNLLHATNVALLFVLLRRLIAAEMPALDGRDVFKARLSAATVTLIFALHPIAAEPVAAVNYSSDLLVTFFTLVALLSATAFRPENFRVAVATGLTGTFCAFATVASKESGIAAALLLVVYWFLFRRGEAKGPWLLFLGAGTAVSAAFLAAVFRFAPPNPIPVSYLGGSFSEVFLIQPRFWVFMMGKLIWPVSLSADYTLGDTSGLSLAFALAVLVLVVAMQAWLAAKSRLGALGVAIYWLGLITVSNFIPLHRILADRFYYLPLTGVAMQLCALLLMMLGSRLGFRMAMAFCLVAILPLTRLTLAREEIFSNSFSLWSDTIQSSPGSGTAHYNLGNVFLQQGRLDEAMAQYREALEINPHQADVHNNLGNALLQKGRIDEEMAQYQESLEINPYLAEPHCDFANAFLQKGRLDEAMAQYQEALKINPNYVKAHYNLAHALLQKGRIDEAMIHFQKILEINPDNVATHGNLGIIYIQKGRLNDALTQFQEALRLDPHNSRVQDDLAKAQAMVRQSASPSQ